MIRSVRRGRSPNCSATGSVVGMALASVALGSAVINAFADRFQRWRDPGEPPSGGGPPDEEEGDVRLRREAFGGIVAWNEPPALLYVDEVGLQYALDREGRLVGHQTEVPGALSAPTEIHLAVTGRCPVACTDCYLSAGPQGPVGPDFDALVGILEQAAAAGVFEVAFGGGEGMQRDDLFDLARAARRLGLVPNLTTTGFGVTERNAGEIAELFGQINISLDGWHDTTAVRGWDASRVARRAITRLVDVGARVGVNTVLTRDNFVELHQMAGKLHEAGVIEWQWLRLKPAGRATGIYDKALGIEQAMALYPLALEIEAMGLGVRFDCAMVPFLVAHGLDAEHLARLGVTGCPGGDSLLTRTVDGRWSPCSFAAPGGGGELDQHWRSAPDLLAWRARAENPPEPCASCEARAVCRGGCRVVADFVTGDLFAPDPDCPRVREHSCAR